MVTATAAIPAHHIRTNIRILLNAHRISPARPIRWRWWRSQETCDGFVGKAAFADESAVCWTAGQLWRIQYSVILRPSNAHRLLRWLVCLGVLTVVLPAAAPAHAQVDKAVRTVTGTVYDGRREPLKGAVVQLESEVTATIVTYVTGEDGRFSFKRVSANDDYRIFATFRGHRSHHRELSRFSNNASPNIRLVIRAR